MTDSIKKLIGLEKRITDAHKVAVDCDHMVLISQQTAEMILAAIRDLEGIASGKDKIVPVEVLLAIEPHLDAIVCYASTMSEHLPNRAVQYIRAMLSAVEKKEA